jgi:hypothetical protein
MSHPSYPPNLITLAVFSEAYKLWNSSLCNFLQVPVSFSLLGPNIFLIVWSSKHSPSQLFPYGKRPSFITIQNRIFLFLFVLYEKKVLVSIPQHTIRQENLGLFNGIIEDRNLWNMAFVWPPIAQPSYRQLQRYDYLMLDRHERKVFISKHIH